MLSIYVRRLSLAALTVACAVVFAYPVTAQVSLGPPPPIPPVIETLKNPHLATALVTAGKPSAAIITPSSGRYDAIAAEINAAVKKATGITLPVISDDSTEAAVPLTGNRVILGNRSTNRTLEELYNRYFCLLDLRYPGPGGRVVRTLHNPFGNEANAILIGGSNDTGVTEAARRFTAMLPDSTTADGTLEIGRIADISLGSGVSIPHDKTKFDIWEASEGYRSSGYFGWTSISMHMAAYYMTGDEYHAREFLRLAFPDSVAKEEIAVFDGERIENKNEPLSGPYHYNAHMLILFWDLIEESPVFTDEDRLRVTNAFSKQLNHRKSEGIYGRTEPFWGVGSRHGQWAAVSLYCLARYFDRDYPSPIWKHSIEASESLFASLNMYAWVNGENDNLFWYDTGIAPIFTYLLLSGERRPIENGVARTLTNAFEMLASGFARDWALQYASIGFLHKAAYLFDDGRFIHYRQRLNLDMDVTRLGQSFWPGDSLEPVPPDDLAGRWSINYLSEPSWRDRNNGFPLDKSFQWGSYRSAADSTGDFILIDGYNGESRNPSHTFDILQLRIGGDTILDGYRNQVLTSSDGLYEPVIAKNAALQYIDVIGSAAIVEAEVPNAAYCSWRRSIIHRTGAYSLIADELTFREDSDNMEVEVLWEPSRRRTVSSPAPGMLSSAPRNTASGGTTFSLSLSDPLPTAKRNAYYTMQRFAPVAAGDRLRLFTLIAPVTDGGESACVRVAPNAAALSFPEPGIVVRGEYRHIQGDLVVITPDHLTALGLWRSGEANPVSSPSPVDIDWDFDSGICTVLTSRAVDLRLLIEPGAKVRLDGRPVTIRPLDTGGYTVSVPAGKHTLDNVPPRNDVREAIRAEAANALQEGRARRLQDLDAMKSIQTAALKEIMPVFRVNTDKTVAAIEIVESALGEVLGVAAGNTVSLFNGIGHPVGKMSTDGPVRVLHWWPEKKLLVAGCIDEQVVAFTADGDKSWSFTSVMDPEVFRAAKTYWFKSAPGHEGIQGLGSGIFLNNENQLFVGSACTIEILDGTGNLIHRMPQFWGPPHVFRLIDGLDGFPALLAARRITGVHRVGIISAKTLKPDPRGFNAVPEGVTYVGGWMGLNRNHIFYEDLDGDGTKEVISDINGVWNRVTVWNTSGKGLYDASFGPGERMPTKTMRDLDIIDADNDGSKEIFAATAKGLVVCLDRTCTKRWARLMPAPCSVLQTVRPADGGNAFIIVGCEDGAVYLLDSAGNTVAKGTVNGTPTCIAPYSTRSSGPGAVIGTNRGETAFFAVDRR